jgi:tetratricopeptide (TPR) repeat protein
MAALGLAEQHGDWRRASLIGAAFAVGESISDARSADVWLDRATEAARRSGNPFALGNIIGVRGRVASRAGRLEEAERSFVEARAFYRSMGDGRFDRILASELAHVLRREGRLDDAEAEYRETIRGWQQSGNRGAIANQLECFAFLAAARDEHVRAARLLGAASALRERADASMTDFEQAEYDGAVERLRATLDEATFDSEMTAGGLLTADEAIALALSG